jgi:hypothetical protein
MSTVSILAKTESARNYPGALHMIQLKHRADFQSASTITERYHTPSKPHKHIDKLLMTSSL